MEESHSISFETAMFSQIEQRPKTPQIEPQPGNFIDYDSVINNALSVFPNGSLYRIYLPKKIQTL
ncbi:hypothetical protein ACOBV9_19775 (plasmid) [Pseudoalteromonas espejiana]